VKHLLGLRSPGDQEPQWLALGTVGLSRIRLLLILVLVAPVTLTVTRSNALAKSRLPNIIIFIADDLGWGDISPYNRQVSWTPNIQRLADEGTTYTQFYTPMAVCTPFRYALLTGLQPLNDRMTDGPIVDANDPRGISLELTTLPERLQALGYHTAAVGKWHLSIGAMNATHGPRAQGFDFYRGSQHDPITGASIPLRFENMPLNYTRAAQHFLATILDDGPYFLYVAYTTPHIPIFSNMEGVTGAGLYADSVYEIDWSIGQILQAVDLDQTIIMFFSDNGPYAPYLNEHGEPVINEGWALRTDLIDIYGDAYFESQHWGGGSNENHFGLQFRPPEYDDRGQVTLNTYKSSHYEGGIRIAAIIRWLDQEVGGVDKTHHQIMDLYATLEERLFGAKVHATDGVNLFSENPETIFIYTRNSIPSAIILEGRWKYHLAEEKLYDLRDDPGEQVDIAATHLKLVEQIISKMGAPIYLPLVFK